MLWAAVSLAFFGFLRLSELTCNTNFCNEIHLAAHDVSFNPNHSNTTYMIIRMKASKTDPFRCGRNIIIGKTGLPICPVAAMAKYLSINKHVGGPLFSYRSSKALTKARLTAETRSLLQGRF